MQSGHSEWDNKKCRDENVWSVHRMYHGQCPGHWASVGDAEDTELWSVATSPFSDTRGVKLRFSALVIMTVLGIRDLVSSGLYSRDPIVTDFTFATTLVTLFGPHRKTHCSWSKLVKIWRIFCLELIKLFRTARNDPEQRPRILDRAQHHYDFIIVGKCCCFLCKYFTEPCIVTARSGNHFSFPLAFCRFANLVQERTLLTSNDPNINELERRKL